MTTVIFSPSWSAVTSSVGFIRYVPSPMQRDRPRPRAAPAARPAPAGHLVAHAREAELEVAVAAAGRVPQLEQVAGRAAGGGDDRVARAAPPRSARRSARPGSSPRPRGWTSASRRVAPRQRARAARPRRGSPARLAGRPGGAGRSAPRSASRASATIGSAPCLWASRPPTLIADEAHVRVLEAATASRSRSRSAACRRRSRGRPRAAISPRAGLPSSPSAAEPGPARPRHGALAGERLADRDAERLGERRRARLGLGVVDAAAGDDQRPLAPPRAARPPPAIARGVGRRPLDRARRAARRSASGKS